MIRAGIAVGFMGAILLCQLSSNVQAQARYEAAKQKFQRLVSNSKSFSTGARFKKPAGGTRFEIDPVKNFDQDEPPYQCGIAVWFQLSDGRYVNPVKHRWNPDEKFSIWIKPAVPVTISLHQNYPEDRPASRQVYPDDRHPETFRDFAAGQSQKLPVAFRMDDDLRDEIMSMVVVRCDSGLLPFNDSDVSDNSGNNSGNSGNSGPGGVIRATSRMQTQFNDEANAKGTINGVNSRFDIVGPEGPDCPEISQDPSDVQFFMFGTGFSHQFQITLKK